MLDCNHFSMTFTLYVVTIDYSDMFKNVFSLIFKDYAGGFSCCSCLGLHHCRPFSERIPFVCRLFSIDLSLNVLFILEGYETPLAET